MTLAKHSRELPGERCAGEEPRVSVQWPRRTYMVDRETRVVKAPGVMVVIRLS